jgi:hypothetical protein
LIEHLGADDKYVAADASQFLQLRSDEATHWLRETDSMSRPAWMRAVRDWARDVLRPRAGL